MLLREAGSTSIPCSLLTQKIASVNTLNRTEFAVFRLL